MQQRGLSILFGLVAFLIVVPSSGRLLQAAAKNFAFVSAQQDLMLDARGEVCPQLTLANQELNPRAAFASESQNNFPVLAALYAYARQDNARARRLFTADSQKLATEWFWLGCVEWRAGNHQEAFTAWRHARAGAYFTNHAYQHDMVQDFARAYILYEIAVAVAPDSSAAWKRLAELEFERALNGTLGWDAALDTIESAVRHSSDDPLLRYRLGYALWVSGKDMARAQIELRRAWAGDKNWLIAYALGSVLLEQGEREESISLLEYAVSQGEGGWATFNLMRAYAEGARCGEATTLKTRMLRAHAEMINPLREWCRTSACPCELYP